MSHHAEPVTSDKELKELNEFTKELKHVSEWGAQVLKWIRI